MLHSSMVPQLNDNRICYSEIYPVSSSTTSQYLGDTMTVRTTVLCLLTISLLVVFDNEQLLAKDTGSKSVTSTKSASSAGTAPQKNPDISGTWTGYFPAKNVNGNPLIMSLTFVVARDSSDASRYHFTETCFLKFDNPDIEFSCSSTNSLSVTFRGDIEIENNTYKFIHKTVSNPKCGTLNMEVFRFNGENFEAVNVNGGLVTSGTMSRN